MIRSVALREQAAGEVGTVASRATPFHGEHVRRIAGAAAPILGAPSLPSFEVAVCDLNS